MRATPVPEHPGQPSAQQQQRRGLRRRCHIRWREIEREREGAIRGTRGWKGMRCAPIQQERVLARREQSRGRAIGSAAPAVEGHGGGYVENEGAIFLAILVAPGIDEQSSKQTIRTI